MACFVVNPSLFTLHKMCIDYRQDLHSEKGCLNYVCIKHVDMLHILLKVYTFMFNECNTGVMLS